MLKVTAPAACDATCCEFKKVWQSEHCSRILSENVKFLVSAQVARGWTIQNLLKSSRLERWKGFLPLVKTNFAQLVSMRWNHLQFRSFRLQRRQADQIYKNREKIIEEVFQAWPTGLKLGDYLFLLRPSSILLQLYKKVIYFVKEFLAAEVATDFYSKCLRMLNSKCANGFFFFSVTTYVLHLL